MTPEFTIIGLGKEVVDYLNEGRDLCFGKEYAKTSPDCISCRAPCVLDGKVVLMKELCAMACAGTSSPIKLNRLNSTAVMAMLERGDSYSTVFKAILADAPPEQAAAAARQLLVDRLAYLKTVGFDPGPVPRTKDLLNPSEEKK